MYKNIFVLFLMLVVPVIFSGCGSKSVERVSVEGVVTFEGKPLNGGYLLLRPEAGPGSGAEIKPDGSYKIEKSAGPMAGNCDFIVEKYNERTELGSDGRESKIQEPALPENIQGKPKPFTLKKGHNKIDINLDQ
ncbi:MAG: hypothetical protein LBQ66_13835 [Planctomycetaceae bacterium]|jgi:hypothetical protein|nr:hypothetical protein [Planctomycetaceae bacterium]